MEAFPLQWPSGRPRTQYPSASKFGARTIDGVIRILLREIKLLDAGQAVISSNTKLRLDGLPYSGQAQPADRGVAVYFTHKERQMCFACDRWDKVQDNVYAISMTIEALRGIERWGTGDMVEQAFTGFVALPAPKSPHEVLGIRPGASDEEIDAAYRRKAMAAHPDRGGSAAAMAELTEARRKLKERAA
jgi:DnaJ-domain-containing protein 1